MRKWIRIPRKDHEVYFLDISNYPILHGKKFFADIMEKLSSMHPGYSTQTVIDIQTITIGKKNWAMVTVMGHDVLYEYRLLYPKCFFYTTTSEIVHTNDFLTKGMNDYFDERIGFSDEKSSPISIPFVSETNNETYNRTTHISKKASVFKINDTRPFGYFIAFIISLTLLGIVFFIFSGFNNSRKESIQTPIKIVELPFMPTAFRILEDIAEKVLFLNGKIVQFTYDEDAPIILTLHVRECEPTQIILELRKILYLQYISMSDIRYDNKRAFFSLQLSGNFLNYKLKQKINIVDEMGNLLLLEDVKEATLKSKGRINSQQISIDRDGTESMSVDVSISANSLTEMFTLSEDLFVLKKSKITKMSLSYDKILSQFSLQFTLVNISPSEKTSDKSTANIGIVPLAFGYSKQTVVPQKKMQIKDDSLLIGYKKIGAIRNEDNKIVVYYRNLEGKILMIEELDEKK